KMSYSNLNKGQMNSPESFKNELLQNQLDISDEQSDTQVSSNTQLINVSRRGAIHAQKYFDNKRYTHSSLSTTANNKQFAYQLEFSDSDSVQRIKKLTPKEQQIRGIKKSYSGQARLLIKDA